MCCPILDYFKEKYLDIFDLWFFHQTVPLEPLIAFLFANSIWHLKLNKIEKIEIRHRKRLCLSETV